MNSYGFFINKATDWWSLKSGYFSRDHPQLNKILPRPRSTRPIKVQLPDTANVSAEKFPPRDESRSPPSDTADESLINRPKNSVRSSSVPKSLPMTSDVKKKPSVDMESRPARKVSKRALDAVSKKEAAAAKKSRNRIPHGTFPELLHQFVCECSLSNPDVVRWNSNRTAFNVEVHHPALPNLLSKYFQRKWRLEPLSLFFCRIFVKVWVLTSCMSKFYRQTEIINRSVDNSTSTAFVGMRK